jgi:single stranded DNA-binding protein
VHLNSVHLIGRLSKRPELRYTESGTPFCSLVVACDDVGPGEKIFTTWIPVDITGKYAEQTSVDLNEGDEVQISGKLKYKSMVDKQTQQKVSKLIVSTWGIQQRTHAESPQVERTDEGKGDSTSHKPSSAPEPTVRKARYKKWTPEAVAPN